MNKEHLLKQRAAIDEALDAIVKQEKINEENRIALSFTQSGQYVPLKKATVKRDVFYFTGDERVETFGYASAREILGSPAFKAKEVVVLIKNHDNKKVWVSEKADGNYHNDRYGRHHMTEGEAEDYITISQ